MQKKVFLKFLVIMMFAVSFFILPIYGDVPSVQEISILIEEDTKIILEVRHGSPSSAHYVDIIEVKISDDIHKLTLELQNTVTFSEELVIDKLDVKGFDIRAHCTLHGWSKWKAFNTETTVEDTSNGIPGFPILSILIGFLFIVFIQKTRTN